MTPTPPVEIPTITEKAALTSGASFWATKSLPGSPRGIVLTDGPHGVRAQKGAHDHLGIAPSEPATCFPPAAGLSQSWDPDLVERIGAALGREARHYGVGVLLGPGVNIKRDPRGGRNFEYFSEDPHLTGVLGSAWVDGIQGEGIGASVKHFAANNAEHDRMRSDSQVDTRALREIYLRGFERIVTGSKPWTVMCAYNKLNGVYTSENRWLLTDVLRGEWGFDGAVVSDWGAVRDRVAAVRAGLDLTMPGGDAQADAALAEAVACGELDPDALEAAAGNVVRLIERSEGASGAAADFDEHHALAREAASRSIVLLQNRDEVLPLSPGASIAVIGRFAQTPRYQGGGSSHVRATRVEVPLDELRALSAAPGRVEYAEGWPASRGDDEGRSLADAVAVARAADVAVLFLGLDDADESEGFDRDDIELPARQLALLRAVAAAQPRTVVVLSHGGVLRLAEVSEHAAGILDGGLLGQAGGGAIADVLFGAVNPSGRLSETVPVRIQDAPSYLNFPGENSRVLYGESIYVGYRWYDARELEIGFPFGHGLSYTTFRYDTLALETDAEGIRARVRITNTGDRAGREVVQLYVAAPESAMRRAPRELKGFRSVAVQAGETVDTEIRIRRDDLAYWDERIDGWQVEPGRYLVSAGASSRDLRLTEVLVVDGDQLRLPLSMESTLGEVMSHPLAGPLFAAAMGQGRGDEQADDTSDALGGDTARMAAAIPLDRLRGFSGGSFDPASIAPLLERANGA
ncbi:glycoside hydrolase family 3 C-terminal domain-containing protein [Leifsonia poae]|uniref:glycoside hydrolase family 3 C-terminal domain-containing protein n=1 Tax=Leifsonia poae TaxID=110933 RepID=UPI001CBFE102|nr:glycoside hydrolase family 3 C-terminal domain-containing protein [Leifsonia poae]